MKILNTLLKSTKSRIIVVGFIGIVAIIGFISFFRSSSETQVNPADFKVKGLAADIPSTPGAQKLSKQYLTTLLTSEQQTTQEALRTGKSAIPTLINMDNGAATGGVSINAGLLACSKCCCGPSTSDLIDELVNNGDLSPVAAAELKTLAESGASVGDYAAKLNELVREGKLTPDQARKLLNAYEQEHGKLTADELANQLVASGQLSADVAQRLNQLSSTGATVGDYAAELNQLVKEGKLTPQEAERLLAAYRRQTTKVSQGDLVDQLVAGAEVSPDVGQALQELSTGGLSPGRYAAELNKLVQEGKLTPEQARRLLANYNLKQGAGSIPESAADIAQQLSASGRIPEAVGQTLADLANDNVSPSDYAAKLQELVKEGKLTPDQAKRLLAAYRIDHNLPAKTITSSLLDELSDSGKIPQNIANDLMSLSEAGATPNDYAAKLKQLVKEGKLTPEEAQQLLATYRQDNGLTPLSYSDDAINALAASGAISPAVASELKAAAGSSPSVGDYAATLDRLVREGKLTPDQAKQLLAAYRREHQSPAANAASKILDQMTASGKIDPATASELENMVNKNISPEQYQAELDRLVREGKLTPEQAQELSQAYQERHAGRISTLSADQLLDQLVSRGDVDDATASALKQLSSSGVPAAQYASELNQLVAAGKLTPEQAMKLLDAYKREHGLTSTAGGSSDEANMLRAQQRELLKTQEDALDQQVQSDKRKKEAQEQLQHTRAVTSAAAPEDATALASAMDKQAKDLFSSWSVPTQEFKFSKDKDDDSGASGATESESSGKGAESGSQSSGAVSTGPIIKSGSIMFAVLNTAVNSDEPGPVMATMVSGKYKGAKLMGSLALTQQNERVMLKFTSLSMDAWPKNVPISAVAINPDTAHTAIASNVDHHYLERWGSLFASNFLAGYAQGVSQSGSTATNSAGTSTTTKPDLDPRDKMWIAFGSVGQAVSKLAGKWMDRPATVTVDAGVGIGILFTEDVKRPDFSIDLNT